eukprot:3772348-Rhodomonas_salina.1
MESPTLSLNVSAHAFGEIKPQSPASSVQNGNKTRTGKAHARTRTKPADEHKNERNPRQGKASWGSEGARMEALSSRAPDTAPDARAGLHSETPFSAFPNPLYCIRSPNSLVRCKSKASFRVVQPLFCGFGRFVLGGDQCNFCNVAHDRGS